MARINPLVPKAGTKYEYTVEQLQELAKCAQDPLYFIEKYVRIQHATRGNIPFDMYDYQRNLIDIIHNNQKTITCISRQAGKAICLDEDIPTPTGFVKMRDVKEGTKVLGRDGKACRVVAVSEIHHKPTFRITFDDGSQVVASDDHLWNVRNTTDPSVEQTLSTLAITEIQTTGKWFITNTKAVNHRKQTTELDPYEYGRLVGYDASYSRIEEEYLVNNIPTRLATLQGIVDTLGIIDEDGYCTIPTARRTDQLKADIAQLIESLGWKVIQDATSLKFWSTRYRMEISRNPVTIAKLSTKTPTLEDEARYITSIQQIDTRPTKCIRVDSKDSMFLVSRHYIPTHNSTLLSSYVLWFAIFQKDKTILMVSNHNKNAMELIQKVRYAYEYLPNWLKPGADPSMWTKHEIGFDNHSRILSQSTTEQSGRGLAISMVLCDELAFVNPKVAMAFWTSISPTISTGGKAAIISTPNGDSNLYAQLWRGAEAGTNGYVPTLYTWKDVPHLTQQMIDQKIAELGQDLVDQEYNCHFISNEDKLFRQAVLDSFVVSREVSTNNLAIFEDITANYSNDPSTPGATYLVGIDPSTGTNNDFSAIEVFRVGHDGKLYQVAEFKSNAITTGKLWAQVKTVLKMLSKDEDDRVYFTFENNGIGEGLVAMYENDPEYEDFDSCQLVTEGNRPGMTTTGPVKSRFCLVMKDLIESGRMVIRSHNWVKEAKTYTRQGNTYKAQYGSTDDLMSATLLITRLLEEVSEHDEQAYDALYDFDIEGVDEDDTLFLPIIV